MDENVSQARERPVAVIGIKESANTGEQESGRNDATMVE